MLLCANHAPYRSRRCPQVESRIVMPRDEVEELSRKTVDSTRLPKVSERPNSILVQMEYCRFGETQRSQRHPINMTVFVPRSAKCAEVVPPGRPAVDVRGITISRQPSIVVCAFRSSEFSIWPLPAFSEAWALRSLAGSIVFIVRSPVLLARHSTDI
jgi:hypothetical protein